MGLTSKVVTLSDGVQVVVPDSLECCSSYILQEQKDWFEDELRFLRRLLQPGARVIDIGANHGVYTLCMANLVGSDGHVWSFEPASSTMQFLAQGVTINGYSQVTLDDSALSSSNGLSYLALDSNSELNYLVHEPESVDVTESVKVATLDACLEKYGWLDIEFVKIDAEGEEINILHGGERFFTLFSPLIQYEIKSGRELHLNLVKHFTSIGYNSYYLLPGLNLLVPFDEFAVVDEYLLNLFCCKPDRAAILKIQGVLLDRDDIEDANVLNNILQKDEIIYKWQSKIANLAYGRHFLPVWESPFTSNNRKRVEKALELYAFSQDPNKAPLERYWALRGSYLRLSFVCENEPTFSRLASLGRVARDFGERCVAVSVLAYAIDNLLESDCMDEPFLMPMAYYDDLCRDGDYKKIATSAVLEAFLRLRSYSSYFTGLKDLELLENLLKLGCSSAEMERRFQMINKRFSLLE